MPAELKNIASWVLSWFLYSGLKIIAILFLAKISVKIIGKIIDKSVRKAIRNDNKEGGEKRKETLIRIFIGFLRAIIWSVAAIMIISQFGLDIGPILAGAGILGVALGFGAQWVVRDFLAGIFIIAENQYRIGDVICLDGTCGLVEDINLRKTILRDMDGTVHYIPNGEIRKASNLSKGFSRVNLNIGISYSSDLEKVIKTVNKAGEDMAKDPDWKDSIISAPKFLRIDNFADSAIIIKILGETKPLKQWDVTGELRKRIKIVFDKEKIEIPFPQVSVWQKANKGK